MTFQAGTSFTVLQDKSCNYTLHIQLYVFQSDLISILFEHHNDSVK